MTNQRAFWMTVTVIILCLGGFIALGLEVTEMGTPWLDQAILEFMRNPGAPNNPAGPPWVEKLIRDIDALGGFFPLTYFSLSLLFYLLFRHQYRAVSLLSVTIAGGGGLSLLFKTLFSRPRPNVVEHGAAFTSSFPSGHAMMSLIVYLLLASVLAHMVTSRGMKIVFLFQGIFLALLIGASRIYMGSHWPTDVVAGWLVGLAWIMTCWLVALKLERREVLDRDTPLPGG